MDPNDTLNVSLLMHTSVVTRTTLLSLLDSHFVHFIYLFNFWGALGLRCYAWAFSSCSELLFVVVRRLLTVVASLAAEHGL